MTRLIVTIALAAYNNLTNLWRPFHGPAYVPMNLAATAILVALSVGPLDLTLTQLGIATISAGDLAIGGGLGAAVGGLILVFALTGVGARRIADRRVTGLRGKKLAYQMLIRVPLGTAVLEEVAFRGVLVAAWRDLGIVEAAVISSVVFGIWHVVPAKIMTRTNDPTAPRAIVVRNVVATVIAMTAAGLFLVWLRVQTGSIGAPLALHATLNSLATGAGVVAARRR